MRRRASPRMLAEQAGDRSVSGRGAPEKGSSALQEDSERRRVCAVSWEPRCEGQPGCSALGLVPRSTLPGPSQSSCVASVSSCP